MNNRKTTAENLLNLKLDALKGAIVMLAKASPYTDDAVLIVSDIDDAWRDEESEPRKVGKADPLKIEVNTVTASEVYSHSLGEPSDGELQRRVARLLGATNVIKGPQSGMLMGYWPEEDEGRGEGWKLIEDYPKDRIAAMTLVDRLEELGYVVILVNTTSGNLKAVRVIEGVVRWFPPKHQLDHMEEPLSEAIANVQDVTLARAITRAFIAVMEREVRKGKAERRTPDNWLKDPQFHGLTISDPDGWDRQNFTIDWAKPLTRKEMWEKVNLSSFQMMCT